MQRSSEPGIRRGAVHRIGRPCLLRGLPLLCIGLALFFLARGTSASSSSGTAVASHEPPPSALVLPYQTAAYRGHWQYRWGDSPRDASGTLLWSLPGEDSAWLALPSSGNPPGRGGQSFLWLRTRLDGPDVHDPALQIEIIDQLCEAFLDGQPIYRFGQLDGSGRWARRPLGYPVHYIPLGRGSLARDYRGGILTLRIYSEHLNIGLFGQQRIGTRLVLEKELFRRDISLLVVAILLLAVGLFSLTLFRYQRQDLSYLSYGGFAFFVGLYALCRMKSGFWVDEHPLIFFYIELFAFYTCIPCLVFFLHQVLGPGPLRLMPALAFTLAGYDVVAWLAIGLGGVPPLKTLLPFQLLALIGVVYTLVSATVALLRGSRDARVLGLGFLLAAGFSAYDMLAAIGILPRVRTSFAHFGHGAFGLSLGLILVFRFQRVYADLLSTKSDLSEKYAALQARTAEVEQLNSELRHQIEARSKSLVDSLLGGSSSSQEAVPILAIDSVLNQRYRIVQILGQGAMGVVYEVRRLTDGKRLAAKVLSGQTRRKELARFAREGQLLARLNHPNLVRIVDVDLLDGRLAYLVMELVEGGTLAGRQARYGQLAFAIPVIRQIASALAQVHAEGIVHRDLKPANILLAAGNAIEVKLADFGVSALLPTEGGGDDDKLARPAPDVDMALYNITIDEPNPARPAAEAALPPGPAPTLGPPGETQGTLDGSAASVGGALTQTGVIIGTPLYMAPELVKGAKLARPASDVFSLGVVAYELLTGELPSPQPPIFLNLRPGQRWYTPLSIRCPDLPGPLADLIERCLDPAPDRRPSAQALADALNEFPEAIGHPAIGRPAIG
ncbi:MAG TPA: protein kinase [Pseudomonadota bacterium]|nr:protein kinase [Pseudomonadota bacterium]